MSRAAEAGASISSLTFLWRISAASLGHTYYGIFFFCLCVCVCVFAIIFKRRQQRTDMWTQVGWSGWDRLRE